MLNRLRAWTTWGVVLGRLPPKLGALGPHGHLGVSGAEPCGPQLPPG